MTKGEGGSLEFVVHKHRATSLHYDLRLESEGVMPSWAVPKGPTLDPRLRRLAMPTGPHDLAYRHFEGVLLKGSYGAGPVMVWDLGKYNPEVEEEKGVRVEITRKDKAEVAAAAGLKKGELKFRLYGKKLQGSFALIRTKGWGAKEAWLLIKHRDDFAKEGYDANDYDFSAVSGKSISEIASTGTFETG